MNVLIYDVDFKSSGVEYPIKDCFEANGWKADMFDWRKFLFSYQHASLLNRIKDRFLFDVVCLKINKELKRVVARKKYHLVLVVRGEHLFPETIAALKRQVGLIVNWSSDDLFNKLNSSRYVVPSIPFYDIHFSPRRHLRNEYMEKGAARFEVIDWYYRKEMQLPKPAEANRAYRHDVSFVGSWSARREGLLLVLDNSQFDVFGWGWKKKVGSQAPTNWSIHDPVSMVGMVDIFAHSKININIFTIENRDRINPRTFDLCAAGGFQLSEKSDELLEEFEEDKEIVCYNNREEIKSKAAFYLKEESLRQKICLAAYEKVTGGNYDLQSRVQQIINIVKA